MRICRNIFCLSILSALALSTAAGLHAATTLVQMRQNVGPSYLFDPTNITISPGDTVEWTNASMTAHDSTHYTTTGPRLWASPLLASTTANNSFSFTFVNAGVYPYYCQTHFFRGHTEETGTVAVVSPNLPPTVTIATPTNGSAFFAPAEITLQADAVDTDGQIASVEFVNGTTSLPSESATNPYILRLTLPAGEYQFTAVATDNQGARSTSGVVNVTVTAPPTITLGLAQQLPDGTFQFRVSGGSAGQTCVIDISSHLDDVPSLTRWLPILTNTFPNTACPFVDFADCGTNTSLRFYRSRVFPWARR